MSTDARTILDAAYRLELPPGQWLEQVLEVIGPLSPTEGLLGCEFRADARTGAWVELTEPHIWGDMVDEVFAFAKHIHDSYPSTMIAHAYTAPDCTRLREVFTEAGADPAWIEAHLAQIERLTGSADGWRLVGASPDGRGVLFAGRPSEGTPMHGPAERARWRRIGAHLASAHRLRRRLGRIEDAEAIFERDGREVALTTDEARDRRARLAEAVTLHRRCRSRDLTGEEALDAWTALLEGRWSIVERVDRDGRRYIVAHANEVPTRPLGRLGAREREVVEYAAHGHPNGLIAYELGIANDSVASTLRRALAKLGFASRIELIRARQALASATPRREPPPGEDPGP